MNAGASSRNWLLWGAALIGFVFALLFGLILLGTEIEASECGGAGGGPGYAPSQEALSDIPGNYLDLYQQAADAYQLGGDGWTWLAGVGSIETNHGRLNAPGVTSGENGSGAGGPMQFLASTWARYGVDGNGDGRTDRHDPRDAIPAAANYLKESGAPGDWRRALFAYNHATWYVDDVARRAAGYRGAAQSNPGALVASRGSAGQASPAIGVGTVRFPTLPPGPIIQTPPITRRGRSATGRATTQSTSPCRPAPRSSPSPTARSSARAGRPRSAAPA